MELYIMYLFFPTFRLNLVFALNGFSFLSQIQKVEFTALKGSLEPADNGIPVKKHHLPVLTLKLIGCSKFFYDECLWASNKKFRVLHRKERSPAKYLLASAVLCCGRENVFQVGWIKQADKNPFLDFITDSAKLEDLNVICNKLKLRPEHKLSNLKSKYQTSHHSRISYRTVF